MERCTPRGQRRARQPEVTLRSSVRRELASEQYCYVTTTGRTTGTPRQIEIWFALLGGSAYLLAGGGDRAHWVRNLREDARLVVRIGDRALGARARELEPGPESDAARRALFAKYSASGRDLSRWRDQGLLVALDLE